MIHSSRQLKDLIRNLSKSTGVDAYILMHQYMMERFLERVSKSQYRNNFITVPGRTLPLQSEMNSGEGTVVD